MPQSLNFKALKQKLLPRHAEANKSHFGHVLVVGGAPGFNGAARLAGEAALRIGAGLVSIATHPEHAAVLNIGRPELICHGIKNEKDLYPLMERATVIAIGPGLGQSAWSKLCWELISTTSKPLIVDADALNLLAKNPQRKEHWILTPHPGEAARLMMIMSTEEIQKDRVTTIKKLQEDYGGIVILKGAGTLIADEKKVYINDVANPAMATAGMGDVLTGMLAGLVAQGLALIDAANLAVAAHSVAAQESEKVYGQRGLLASDLWQSFVEVLN